MTRFSTIISLLCSFMNIIFDTDGTNASFYTSPIVTPVHAEKKTVLIRRFSPE
jgi:hypothetical protein